MLRRSRQSAQPAKVSTNHTRYLITSDKFREVKSLLYLKDKMDFQSWFKLSQRTCGYLLIFSPLTGDLTVSYQNLLVALRLWPVPTSV